MTTMFGVILATFVVAVVTSAPLDVVEGSGETPVYVVQYNLEDEAYVIHNKKVLTINHGVDRARRHSIAIHHADNVIIANRVAITQTTSNVDYKAMYEELAESVDVLLQQLADAEDSVAELDAVVVEQDDVIEEEAEIADEEAEVIVEVVEDDADEDYVPVTDEDVQVDEAIDERDYAIHETLGEQEIEDDGSHYEHVDEGETYDDDDHEDKPSEHVDDEAMAAEDDEHVDDDDHEVMADAGDHADEYEEENESEREYVEDKAIEEDDEEVVDGTEGTWHYSFRADRQLGVRGTTVHPIF